jgi:uncharacterized membrane protein
MFNAYKKLAYLLLILLPLQAAAFDNYECLGSDPEWRLSLLEKQFSFALKGAATVKMAAVNPTPAEDTSIDRIMVYRTNMKDKNAVIIVQKQSCTDGSSQDVYLYEGLLVTPTKVFHGCCSKKLILTQ